MRYIKICLDQSLNVKTKEVLPVKVVAENNKELDIKLKEAGLLTVEQLMNSPAHPLFMHNGVVDLQSLQQWVKMRYEESLRLKARVQLEEGMNSKSDLAERAIAFSVVFGEVHHHLTKISGDADERN